MLAAAVIAFEIVTATTHLHADHFAERVAGDEFTLQGKDRIQRGKGLSGGSHRVFGVESPVRHAPVASLDRKSTRLNSSHVRISYAVFCLKKKQSNKHLQQ